MPDAIRPHGAERLTAGELARSRRKRQMNLAGPDSSARVPVLTHASPIEAESAGRGAGTAESGEVTS